jgi:hypothetical protein|tara:strand:+ start:3849 stop:4619 length:771 start_codon:yes stop_codon:yes gene_type:complete
MSNFFEEVGKDASAIEEELLGPTYKYYDYINTPSEMGMSSRGSFDNLSDNIGGLINYTKLMVSGGGKASKTGQALGPQFFLKTGQKCRAVDSGDMTTRYIYMSQKPIGNIPFISSGLGVNFSSFKGLIPGTMENLNDMNPLAIFSAFTAGSNPDCQELTMETTPTKINDYKRSETHYVTINDIRSMNPCLFTLSRNIKKNPITKQRCREAFQNLNENSDTDYLVKLFYGSLGIMGLFILFKFMEKNKAIKFINFKQ